MEEDGEAQERSTKIEEIQGSGRTEEMAEEGVWGANSDVTSPWRCNANANETRGERGCVGSVVMEESI